MQEEIIYVKYGNNGTVGFSTHREFDGSLRLKILSSFQDLVAAFQQLPNSPLSNTFIGEITLYYVSNGVETSYNSWDSLTLLGDNGKTGPNPLIIRSLNDRNALNDQGIYFLIVVEMVIDVDPNTNTEKVEASMQLAENTQYLTNLMTSPNIFLGLKNSSNDSLSSQSININDSKVLKRKDLVEKIVNILDKSHTLLIKSPPMSGKTSLSLLLAHHLHDSHKQCKIIYNQLFCSTI